MEWHELRDALAKDRRISHEKQPEYGYARISIDLGDAEYVGTDIPLAFSGDQLAKIRYTGSDTGTYFRLNNRHAQQIFASEFKRSNIPYTKIYLTNPVAQTGKIFSFYIGTGIFAAIQPGSIGAGNELIGLTDSGGSTINPATEDKQDDIKTLQGVDGAGDLQKVKEELKKLTQSIARSNTWNVSAAVYLQNFSVAAQEITPTGIFFKPDGTKMYVIGSNGDDVNEYDLGTPWDISSAVYLQNFSVAARETEPQELFFKPDGTKMYVIGTAGDDVNEYDLGTPWDITTAVWLHLFSVAGQETYPTGIFFKPDGTKMYVIGSANDCVFEYDLDTTLGAPWNVQYADYLQYFSVAAQETTPTGLFFNPTGTKMYVIGDDSDDVNEYDLSTPWDITTAVYLHNFSLAAQETYPMGIFFKPDGTKMYVIGTAGDNVNEYDLRSMNSMLEANQNEYRIVNHKLTVLMGRGLTATGTCNNPTRINDGLYVDNVNFTVDDHTNILTFTKPVLMKQFRMYGDTGGTTNVTGDGRFDIYYWDEAVNDYVLWRYDLPVRQTNDWSGWEEVSLVLALKIKIVARIHDTGGVGGSAYREMEFKY